VLIEIDITLKTDGDFELLDLDPSIRKMADFYTEGYEWYNIHGKFEKALASSCKIEARTFLERILCDIHVCSNHRYLLPIIYNMFDKAIQFINITSVSDSCYEIMSGNYEGTSIEVTIM